MKPYKALIAGVTGAVGGALARELCSQSQWTVLGLARRAPATAIAGVTYVHADMAQPSQLAQVLREHPDITHLFYCARITHAEQTIEDAIGNTALLGGVLDAAEQAADQLQHVHLVQGGKVYGVHVGPFRTPAREDQPRCIVENFNYDQEDLLRARCAQAQWTWTASRPNTLLHYSPDIARNIVSTLGAYAAIARELGAALDFPGPAGAFTSLTQMTSIKLLAKAIAWVSTQSACANQAFNVTNTDVFRWSELWPRLADAFEVPCGGVRPMRLAQLLADRAPVWEHIRERHGLGDIALEQIANWGFADATLERYWDEILSHNKLRSFGFHGWADSEALFFELIEEYRQAKILP